jgi:hypothetical protein
LSSVTGILGSGMKSLYRSAQPSFYMLAAAVLVMAWIWL